MKSRIFIILVIAGFLAAGCQKKEIFKAEALEIIPVKVRMAELKDIYRTLEYVGTVKAEEEAVQIQVSNATVFQKPHAVLKILKFSAAGHLTYLVSV